MEYVFNFYLNEEHRNSKTLKNTVHDKTLKRPTQMERHAICCIVMIHILPLKWRERQLLVKRGLVLLWMVLHFDLLLRPLSLSALNNTAKLRSLLEAGQALASFRALASSSVTRWMGIS